MATIEETFIRGSDNKMTIDLGEAGVPIPDAFTQIDLHIGPLTITRTTNENGISLASGKLEITPGDMVAGDNLDQLPNGPHVTYIRVITPTETNGVWWGAADSDNRIQITVRNLG